MGRFFIDRLIETLVAGTTTSGTGTGITVEDETSDVGTGITELDFKGTGVTATASGGKATVTIPGATAGGVPAQDSAPTNPTEGDLWVDTTGSTAILKVRQGSAWVAVGTRIPAQDSAPTGASEGDLWVDTTGSTAVLKIRQGSAWVIAGSQGTTSGGSNVPNRPAAAADARRYVLGISTTGVGSWLNGALNLDDFNADTRTFLERKKQIAIDWNARDGTPTNGLSAINVTANGSLYTATPTVQITGGGGSGAAATVTLNGSGGVARVNLTRAGSGYTSTPNIAFVRGSGDTTGIGAAATAVVSGASDPVLIRKRTATGGNPYVLTSNLAQRRWGLSNSDSKTNNLNGSSDVLDFSKFAVSVILEQNQANWSSMIYWGSTTDAPNNDGSIRAATGGTVLWIGRPTVTGGEGFDTSGWNFFITTANSVNTRLSVPNPEVENGAVRSTQNSNKHIVSIDNGVLGNSDTQRIQVTQDGARIILRIGGIRYATWHLNAIEAAANIGTNFGFAGDGGSVAAQRAYLYAAYAESANVININEDFAPRQLVGTNNAGVVRRIASLGETARTETSGTTPLAWTVQRLHQAITNRIASWSLVGNSGLIPVAKLGSGTADGTTSLHGDGSWKTAITNLYRDITAAVDSVADDDLLYGTDTSDSNNQKRYSFASIWSWIVDGIQGHKSGDATDTWWAWEDASGSVDDEQAGGMKVVASWGQGAVVTEVATATVFNNITKTAGHRILVSSAIASGLTNTFEANATTAKVGAAAGDWFEYVAASVNGWVLRHNVYSSLNYTTISFPETSAAFNAVAKTTGNAIIVGAAIASGLTNTTDAGGTAQSSASVMDLFEYDGSNWVLRWNLRDDAPTYLDEPAGPGQIGWTGQPPNYALPVGIHLQAMGLNRVEGRANVAGDRRNAPNLAVGDVVYLHPDGPWSDNALTFTVVAEWPLVLTSGEVTMIYRATVTSTTIKPYPSRSEYWRLSTRAPVDTFSLDAGDISNPGHFPSHRITDTALENATRPEFVMLDTSNGEDMFFAEKARVQKELGGVRIELRATSSTLPTTSSNIGLTNTWNIVGSGHGFTSGGNQLRFLRTPTSLFRLGFYVTSAVGVNLFDSVFIPNCYVNTNECLLGFGVNNKNIDVVLDTGLNSNQADNLFLRGNNTTLPALSTVSVYEVFIG